MRSKVKIFGHPIHPMLVAFPVAFYTATLICYIVYAVNGEHFWFKVGLVANVAGVVMAGLAAIPGFIDWLYLPADSTAKRAGFFHMIANVLALVCYGIVAFVACKHWDVIAPIPVLAIPLTAIGFMLTAIAGYLGWAMVQKHHVGVDDVAQN